jgi:hypothetical protein
MATKKKSHKGKGSYAVYASKNQAEKNRIAKLKRHLKKHPNDSQAEKATKHSGTRRTAPNTKGHFPAKKNIIRDKAGHVIVMPKFTPGK